MDVVSAWSNSRFFSLLVAGLFLFGSAGSDPDPCAGAIAWRGVASPLPSLTTTSNLAGGTVGGSGGRTERGCDGLGVGLLNSSHFVKNESEILLRLD